MMNHMEGITSIVKLNFKTSMSRSSLCDYSDAYLLKSETMTVAALVAGGGNSNIQVVFKVLLTA